MPTQAIKSAIDSTTLMGTGVSGMGFAATFSQYYPMVTGSLAFIVMVMTIAHLYSNLKNSNLENKIKLQQFELNERKLRRATDIMD